MKTPLLLSALCCLLLHALPARAAAELKGSPEELAGYLAGLPALVTVTGESEVKVPADRAEVTLKVSTESKSLGEALRENQALRGRLAAALKEGGVGPSQIQAAKFSSTQKHTIFSEKARSHRIDHFLKVSVRDEKEFQVVAMTVDRWSEVQFLGVEMQHSDKERLKAQAEAQALDKANENRKRYEEKLGVKLVPKRFQQSVSDPLTLQRRASYYAPSYAGGDVSRSGGLDKTTQIPGRGFTEQSDEGPSAFGELTYTARVAVDYAVERP